MRVIRKGDVYSIVKVDNKYKVMYTKLDGESPWVSSFEQAKGYAQMAMDIWKDTSPQDRGAFEAREYMYV